jgi:hypothetical protein
VADGQLEPEEAPQEPSADAGVGQDAPMDSLVRPEPDVKKPTPFIQKGSVSRAVAKRSGEDHSEDEYQTVQESKQQRIGFIGSVVEAMENETVKIGTLEGKSR